MRIYYMSVCTCDWYCTIPKYIQCRCIIVPMYHMIVTLPFQILFSVDIFLSISLHVYNVLYFTGICYPSQQQVAVSLSHEIFWAAMVIWGFSLQNSDTCLTVSMNSSAKWILTISWIYLCHLEYPEVCNYSFIVMANPAMWVTFRSCGPQNAGMSYLQGQIHRVLCCTGRLRFHS